MVINGSGFDVKNGVAVDVFCACVGGKLPTMFLNTGNPNLKSNSITFTLPASTPTGPGSIVVSNAGSGHTYAAKSDAVSVPIGARIIVTNVTQSASTLTVDGAGFSSLTVINFFNAQKGGVVNLGGLTAAGAAEDSDYTAQLDALHLHQTGRRGCGPGLRAGAQSAVRALHQFRQRPLRSVCIEVAATRGAGNCCGSWARAGGSINADG